MRTLLTALAIIALVLLWVWHDLLAGIASWSVICGLLAIGFISAWAMMDLLWAAWQKKWVHTYKIG
ncbi:MAG: hypothetical protein AAB605_04210 [Patescibacteria group bacterium]